MDSYGRIDDHFAMAETKGYRLYVNLGASQVQLLKLGHTRQTIQS